jgi:hypothetical protein
VTTLIKTPGRAPSDTNNAAAFPFGSFLEEFEAADVTKQLLQARNKDPKVQYPTSIGLSRCRCDDS